MPDATSTRLTIPPYLVFFATLILMAPVHLLAPVATVVPSPITPVGLVVVAIGAGLSVAQQRAVRRHRQDGLFTSVPTALITDGPFRFTRNPLYLGMVLITLGIAMVLGSLTVLLLVAAEVTVMNKYGIPHEERVLAAAFGDDYATYRQRVRRWI